MPKLVSYIHVALNHDTEEGAELAEKLAKYPAGERSRIIRTAILAYLRTEDDKQLRERTNSISRRRGDQEKQNTASSAHEAPQVTPGTLPGPSPKRKSGDDGEIAIKAKGLFDLIR